MTSVPKKPRFLKTPKLIKINQETFDNGPYIIHENDIIIKLTSDLVFDFGKSHPSESPFHRGFFAGIIIGASRVTIDLDGHTIKMSKQYQDIQRFFSLISLDVSPLPAGKIGFTTEFKNPSDITIRNGILSLTSHFAIHTAGGSERVLLEHLTIDDYEISAISLSGCSDVCIRHLKVGGPVAPTTTSDAVMLRSLLDSLGKEKASDRVMGQIRTLLHKEEQIKLQALDCIVRAIVIVPKFNVGAVPTPETITAFIHRIRIENITFLKIFALPVETIGASLEQGGDPIKDVNGDLISYSDLMAHTNLCRAQLMVTKKISQSTRTALMNSSVKLYEVHGLDRRGHDLKRKASAFIRVDGATDVDISHIDAETISVSGKESAAVGFMLNVCKKIRLHQIRVRESFRGDDNECIPFNDKRPFSGFYLRYCEHVDMSQLQYPESDTCSCILQEDKNVKMKHCTFSSPIACNKSTNVHMIS